MVECARSNGRRRRRFSHSPLLSFSWPRLSLSLASPNARSASSRAPRAYQESKSKATHVGHSRERKRRRSWAIAPALAAGTRRTSPSSQGVHQGLPTGLGADGVRARAGQRRGGLEAGQVERREHGFLGVFFSFSERFERCELSSSSLPLSPLRSRRGLSPTLSFQLN